MASNQLQPGDTSSKPRYRWQQRLTLSPTSAVTATVSAILALLLYLYPSSLEHPWIDGQADQYFESTLAQASLAYGSTRLINASVSVIMESNLQVQPAGVGLSLAVGQVLDPLNDMAERVSDVLVTAIVALGVQKLLYEMCIIFVPLALLGVVLVMFVCSLTEHPIAVSFKCLLLRLALVLVVLRLFLPVSALLNVGIYQHFFAEQISSAKEALNVESENIQGLADFSKQSTAPDSSNSEEAASFWSQWMGNSVVMESADFLQQKSTQMKQAFLSKQQYAATLIEHLLTLTYLYVAVFLIQVVLLPLMMFYSLIKLGRLLI